MKNWWQGTHRRPTWRKAGINEGFCVRDVRVVKLNGKWAKILVPKVGEVRFRLSRGLPETYGMARITLDRALRWHVSFSSIPIDKNRIKSGNIVGIDRGVTNTLATSDGQMLQVPTLPKLIAKQKSLQVTMSRQVKGSKRRAKTKAKLGLNYARICDRRNDWVEKTTTRLVANYDLIVFEKLNTKNMIRRPKPKTDPDNLESFLPNGARAKENRESQAVFKCIVCGHENNADINAGQVILARGLKVLASTPGPGACRPPVGARSSPTLSAARTSKVEAA